MNLFIDTNIFLSFFHFTNDDLEEIRKLEVLIDKKEVVLWLPAQVKDEFYRNRENKLFDTIKRIKELNISFQFPQIFKDYPEYQEIRKSIQEYKSIFSRLDENVREDIYNKCLKADQVIKELFDKATHIEISAEILERAQLRVAKGNPPGKNGSLGDSINWECLLSKIPFSEDIYLVSEDGDFYSILDESKIKDFLYTEWDTCQQSHIFLYRRLSQFFKEHYPNIKLAAELEAELEKELCVKRLLNSTSFSETHSAISQLKKYTEFNPSQLNEMILAGINNNQIRWILDDSDVYTFYLKLLDENKESVKNDLYGEIISLLDSINSQDQALD